MAIQPENFEPEKKVDWERAKKCLAELQRLAPVILDQGVVIGGAACWFYRHRLSVAKDPLFKVPLLRGGQEQIWLSKDIDITNFFRADAEELLAGNVVTDTKGRSFLQIAGIPIGFAQVGVTFDPESAWADAWIASFESAGSQVQCRVLDPITLYREKQALTQRRGSPSDRLHLDLLTEYLKFEFCMAVGALFQAKNLTEKTEPSKFLHAIAAHAPEVMRDPRVKERVVRLKADHPVNLTPSEESILKEYMSAPPPDH